MTDRPQTVDQLVDHLFRQEFGRMVSRLTRILGAQRLDTAEDAVQYAMVQALQLWPYQGPPDHPHAWLAKVAYHRALDILKRERKLRYYDDEQHFELRMQIEELQATDSGESARFPLEIADERLALFFVCCHPELPRAASVALTLKVLCGFGVAEIARAFLSTETAVAQRLVRAKRLIREQEILCEVPDPTRLAERLDAVLEVLYLLFTEGYAATAGDRLIKNDLCTEAIRLAESLTENPATSRPECHALLALMLLQAARLPARTDALGDLVLLEEQDRGLWDTPMIHRGLVHLGMAAQGEALSVYHLQAEIAAIHSSTELFADTNWEQILELYNLLQQKQPNPVVLINRAIAIAKIRGPATALEALQNIGLDDASERNTFLHAAAGEFHRQLGNVASARVSLQRALSFARTEPQRRFLQKKLDALPETGRDSQS